MKLSKQFKFKAEHYIPGHPTCGKTHSHEYSLEVFIEGEVNPETGMVMDFGDIKSVVNESVISKLENQHLNKVEVDRNKLFKIPSAENIVLWMYEQLEPKLKGLYQLKLSETKNNTAIYSPQQ